MKFNKDSCYWQIQFLSTQDFLNFISMSKRPKWLKRIQENSWEPELLISGGAFFTLLTLSDNFIYWFRDIRVLMGIDFPGTKIIIFLITVAIEGITYLFLFHLIIRAYWTGVIGISYVFPDGIKLNPDKPIHPKFLYTLEDAQHLERYIDKIESVASLVFGITIRFVMSAIGIAIAATLITIAIPQVESIIALVFLAILTLMVLIYLIDVFSNMGIRRSRFASLYYPIYRFVDTITFSFVFRPVTQTLMTHLNPGKIIPIVIVILFFSTTSAYRTLTQHKLIRNIYAGRMYENELDEATSYIPYRYINHWKTGDIKPPFQIGRDVVVEYPTLMVFIEYLPFYDDTLFPIKNANQDVTPEFFRSCFRVSIDGQNLDLNELDFGKNPKTNRLGLIGYYNVSAFSAGKHYMRFDAHVVDGLSSRWVEGYEQIPFWKD